MRDPGEVGRFASTACNDATRPWLSLYAERPAQVEPGYGTALEMARAGLAAAGDSPLIWYFDTALTGAAIDRASDAFASSLLGEGVQPGDRIALHLQNIPQFFIAVVALWKIAAIPVPLNPMLRQRELRPLLVDSGAKVLISLDDLYESCGRDAIEGSAVQTVVTTSACDLVDGPRPVHLPAPIRAADTLDMLELIHAHDGQRPADGRVSPDDVAFIVYTSGTTGPPKGAMNLHRNVVFASTVFRDWAALTPQDVILGLAPLFHITGLIANIGVALVTPTPVVLAYRFDAGEALRLIEVRGASFCVAAITAYIALLNHPGFADADVSSLRAAYSGGAPVPAAVVEAWEAATGTYVHNAYGLTETTSPAHLVPLGARAPVDPTSGALSIGTPVYDTSVVILGEHGQPLAAGEVGELVISGPQVVPGYWQRPEETQHALPDGQLRTGDVGFMDDSGWFYLVDRSKDLIVAAGYKVWPREVEDVLCEHPAVREAAVVGAPDPYRGETVTAFVSLKPGARTSESELIAFCKARLAAYKYPRAITLLDDLPKTATGKILRRQLRMRSAPEGG
jgi:long-chain acyl-CoA synthetase